MFPVSYYLKRWKESSREGCDMSCNGLASLSLQTHSSFFHYPSSKDVTDPEPRPKSLVQKSISEYLQKASPSSIHVFETLPKSQGQGETDRPYQPSMFLVKRIIWERRIFDVLMHCEPSALVIKISSSQTSTLCTCFLKVKMTLRCGTLALYLMNKIDILHSVQG